MSTPLPPIPARRKPPPSPFGWLARRAPWLLLIPFASPLTALGQAQWERLLRQRPPATSEVERRAAPPDTEYRDRPSDEVVTGWSGMRLWPAVVQDEHCTADLWVSPPGTVDRVRISGCARAYHDRALQVVDEAVLATDGPAHVTMPVPALREPWTWTQLVIVPNAVGAALSALALAALVATSRPPRRVAPEDAPAVARDPAAPVGVRRAALALLGPRLEDPDPLLAAASAARSDRRLAATLVTQLRRHPTEARVRFLATEASTAFAAWDERVVEDAQYVLAQGLQQLPAGPETEAAFLALLDAPDPTLRNLAVTGLGRVGTRVSVPRLRAGFGAGELTGRAELAIAQIAARTGAVPGSLAIADNGGGELSVADGEEGRLSVDPRDGGEPPAR